MIHILSQKGLIMSFISNIFSGLKDFFVGTPGRVESASTLNPAQQEQLQRILGTIDPSQFAIQQQPTYQAGQSYLQSLLGGNISQFTDPYMRQFKEQTVPGLAEQFAGLGGLSSSGFQQALGGAASGLQEKLASLRGSLMFGALPQALGFAQAPGQMQLGLTGIGLKPSIENIYKPQTQGLLQQLAPQLAKFAIAYYTGNPGAVAALDALKNISEQNQGNFSGQQGFVNQAD